MAAEEPVAMVEVTADPAESEPSKEEEAAPAPAKATKAKKAKETKAKKPAAPRKRNPSHPPYFEVRILFMFFPDGGVLFV